MIRKILWIAGGAAAALICLLIYFELSSPPAESAEPISSKPANESSLSSPPADAEPPSPPEASEAPISEPYVTPVDFEALWAANEDVYAWLDIPGTYISYPILQHPEDDGYYLRRNLERENDPNGVIYTEPSYTGKDFSDPLTVIYGHNMEDGKMFSPLQRIFSSQEALKEYSEIVIYLPHRELHYAVFAAVPFDNRHILYNYDFTDERTFRLFFQELLSVRTMDAVFAEDASVRSEDKTLILSTCLTGDRDKRFLICGKLFQIIPTESNK